MGADESDSSDGSRRRLHRTEVVASWLLVGCLLAAAAASLVGRDYVWTAFASGVAVVATLPPGVTRDRRAVVPPELLALPTFPVVARSLGIYVPTPALLGPATAYAGVAALGLVIVAELEVFGAVEMTRRFAVTFVAMATMAVAALWVLVRFAGEAVLDVELLPSNAALMIDLGAAVVVGILAGVVLDAYVRWRRPTIRLDPDGDDELDDDADFDPDDDPPEVAERDGSEQRVESVDVGGRSIETALVRGVQVGLVGLAGYSLVRADAKLLVNTAVPLAATLVPVVVGRWYGYDVGRRLAVWIAAAALLHALGTLGLYRSTPWFDQFAHAVSGALVAGIGYALAGTVDAATDEIELPDRFRFAFILVFVLATGVVWELVEFTAGGLPTLLGGEPILVQYGVADTALDLLSDAVGGVAVGLWGGGHAQDAAAVLWRVLADRRPK